MQPTDAALQSQTLSPFTVSQLTSAIKHNLESTFPRIHLQGEVSNFKQQSSGHLYFSLKDADAQISAVMFRPVAALLRAIPKGGDQVIVKGELNVYPPKGNYQLIIKELAYVGIGELLQQLEQLKIKLHQMGWFKNARKKSLPRFPRRIGVVTSPTGAVIQDIINVLSRRFSEFQLILNPVKVQGEGAAKEIALAIEQFNKHRLVDVMIVGRGGGSLEDLWPFNEEIVASAIYHSTIPIICAVGHETDHCIADYVADIRAPTPSAAAEIAIPDKRQLLEYLAHLRKRMQQTLGHLIQKNQYRLEAIRSQSLFSDPYTLIGWRMQKLDDLRGEIDRAMFVVIQNKKHQLDIKTHQARALKPTNQIAHLKERLLFCERALERPLRQLIEKNKQKLAAISTLLHAIDPKNILKKGFSILFKENEPTIIHSISEIENGQQARLRLSDGELLVTINRTVV